jgi:hypothetical protein
MKAKKYHLIMAFVIALAGIPALCEVKPSLPEEQKPALIARRHPELTGIKALYFNILMPEAEAKEHASAWLSLKIKAVNKLEDADIDVIPQIHDGLPIMSPELRVNIDILRLDDARHYVVHIQTLFSRAVSLKQHPTLGLKADVWKTEAVMRLVPIQNMPSALTNVILEQVDAFIFALRSTALSATKYTDANEITVTPKKIVGPVPVTALNKYKYVASKNSKVFHKPDCRWAQQISPKNLVGYNTRQEAIKAGKRPCKRCKP